MHERVVRAAKARKHMHEGCAIKRAKCLKYEYLLLHLRLGRVLHNVVFVGGVFLRLKVLCDPR